MQNKSKIVKTSSNKQRKIARGSTIETSKTNEDKIHLMKKKNMTSK